jgi:D-lactate dehydrogenase
MKTLIYSIHGFDKPFIEKIGQNKHELVFTEQPLNENTTHLAKGFEAVALFTSDNASSKVIEQLHSLGVKFITLRSVGYDHVDLVKAKQLNIKVANVPAYSPYAIAEHSVALLMALNRKIILAQELMKQNDFRLDKLVGFDLHNKTIGVVGTGKIGAAFVRIMHGFGCKIVAYDIEQDNELIEQCNVQYTSLEALCKNSDVISINCPLNEATKYMFNKTTFSKMKNGVVFINTARGGIVNTQDLLDALDQGIVASAGLDVYEYEKPIFFYNHSNTQIKDKLFEKLRAHDSVLITGHQAFLTNEALQGIAKTTIDNLDQWTETCKSENEVY